MNDEKEHKVYEISNEYIGDKRYDELYEYIVRLQEEWSELTVVRMNKIIKNIVDMIVVDYKNYEEVLSFIGRLISWSVNRRMLSLELRVREVRVLLEIGKYGECLEKIGGIGGQLKKYDDKAGLIQLSIYESRAYYEMRDGPRARAALTSARALAVSSACSAPLQAQIDLLNGMYLSDERAYETAQSYFIEALEGFSQNSSTKVATFTSKNSGTKVSNKNTGTKVATFTSNSRLALRYIILANLISNILNKKDSVEFAILNSKYAANIKNDEVVQILLDIANACNKRDLAIYNNILHSNNRIIEADSFIHKHTDYLYSLLLDKNILKIIEPYSHVRINFISSKLGFSEATIEEKLRKMILDKVINGILDHATQCLVFYSQESNKTYDALGDLRTVCEFFN